jgi:hypothetical protein
VTKVWKEERGNKQNKTKKALYQKLINRHIHTIIIKKDGMPSSRSSFTLLDCSYINAGDIKPKRYKQTKRWSYSESSSCWLWGEEKKSQRRGGLYTTAHSHGLCVRITWFGIFSHRDATIIIIFRHWLGIFLPTDESMMPMHDASWSYSNVNDIMTHFSFCIWLSDNQISATYIQIGEHS